jgi:hypothetical protein
VGTRAALVVVWLALVQATPGTSSPEATAAEESRCRRPQGGGAAPGDEKGPGRFVDRSPEKSFYAASGGQLWWYLNLYKWAPQGVDLADLWIQEEVVEELEELRRWPDSTPVEAPPKKTTLESWEVGPTGRTKAVDNHKDSWLLAENWCAGAVRVSMTLRLGRLRVRGDDGVWTRSRTPYVLHRRDYGPGAREGRPWSFEALATEPATVWEYRIAWSACPHRFVRSNWEALDVPALRFLRAEPLVADRPAPVVTESETPR